MVLETIEITDDMAEQLRNELPAVATAAAEAVISEVPGYRDLRLFAGATLDRAVELALRGFLDVAAGSEASDPASPLQPALDGAYSLGRGEARSGRTMDVLLSAYRVGARVAWRKWSLVAVDAGMAGGWLSRFAELNFSYIDELSAASVSGYSDELETLDRTRQRKLERFTRRLLAGGTTDFLHAEAEQAGWQPPASLCAVVLPASRARGVGSILDARTLQLSEDVAGVDGEQELHILLVPLVTSNDRDRLKAALVGRQAVIGPPKPWVEVGSSYSRALQVRKLKLADSDEATDTDEYLADLVIGADPEALSDLRARVLAPLEGLRPSTAGKLTETLRAWLLHQGRREDIAGALFIHPQTVRYRMGQLRDLFGEQLENPETVLALTVALGTRSRQM